MDIQTNWPPGETGIQTALDAVIDGLADAETGTPMFCAGLRAAGCLWHRDPAAAAGLGVVMSAENTPGGGVETAFPVPLAERTWGGWAAAAVAATAGIASWSFVVGGFTAYYVGAREGTATMLAGALFGQLLVTLAQVPVVTKYGIETLASTKPQMGGKGAAIALIVQYATLVGWNIVLSIFLGRAMASVLQSFDLIAPGALGTTAIVCSALSTGFIWLMLQKGASAVRMVGIVVAIGILVLGAWMYWLLFRHYGLEAVLAAPPIAPLEGGRLVNYQTGFELLLVSTLGWWAYMGAMFRMVDGAGKAVAPSMGSLGFGWAAAGLIGLYSALVAGQADPTIWIVEVGGPVAGVFVLLFVALANVGSITVGVHAAAVGFGQLSRRTQGLSWNAKLFSAIGPMTVVLIVFPTLFYDNVGTFLAIIGVMIAPILGIQIADYYVLRRIDRLHVPSLYRDDARSQYWYARGFNPAGIVALIAGSLAYVALLDPLTFVPNSTLFQYTGATLPAVLVGAGVYLAGMRLICRPRRE